MMMLACEAKLFSQNIIPNAVTDIDGNAYNAVQIGEQIWLAENMRAKHDRDGNDIVFGNDGENDTSIYKSYYYCPNHNDNNVEKYGYLYNWPAATKVCPEGWHLPHDYEWTQLIEFVGNRVNDSGWGHEIADALSSEEGWKYSHHNEHRNNSTGFSALPAGTSLCENCFGGGATFWSATAKDYRNAYTRGISDGVLPHHQIDKEIGYSVRCIRDKEPTTGTTFIPNAVTDIDGNVYNAVKIGEQIWMAENMRTTKFRYGQKIELSNRTSIETPYRYYPGDNLKNVPQYGYLYNWAAAINICPEGWHLPTDDEWTLLTDFVSSQEPYRTDGDSTHIAKALASQEGWRSDRYYGNLVVGNEPEKNNATGFSVLPAGMFSAWQGDAYGQCHFFGSEAHFWTETEYFEEGNAGAASLELRSTTSSGLSRQKSFIIRGYSVRCVKD